MSYEIPQSFRLVPDQLENKAFTKACMGCELGEANWDSFKKSMIKQAENEKKNALNNLEPGKSKEKMSKRYDEFIKELKEEESETATRLNNLYDNIKPYTKEGKEKIKKYDSACNRYKSMGKLIGGIQHHNGTVDGSVAAILTLLASACKGLIGWRAQAQAEAVRDSMDCSNREETVNLAAKTDAVSSKIIPSKPESSVFSMRSNAKAPSANNPPSA